MAGSASGVNESGSRHKSVEFYLLNIKPYKKLTDSKFKLRNQFNVNKV